MQEADREVAAAKAAIAEAQSNPYINEQTDRDPTFELLREDLAKTETDLAAQGASLNAVIKTIKSLQAQIIDLDQQAIAQQDLEREVKVTQITICFIVPRATSSGHRMHWIRQALRM